MEQCSAVVLIGHSGCIDKRSSAELSEAVNSMYQWYEQAQICYAHLADVASGNDVQAVRSSDWFTRGWTLQELLAPRRVEFCDAMWTVFGDKHSMAEIISDVTGIGRYYVASRTMCSDASIATKMSWVSLRKTTRKEDIAYCMLGIFDINMPLLYGEGHKAFLRLQLAIIRSSRDHSIFAHRGPALEDMLADSPLWISECGDVERSRDRGLTCNTTQRGLELGSPSWLVHPHDDITGARHEQHCELALDCEVTINELKCTACLLLKKYRGSPRWAASPWFRAGIAFRPAGEIRKMEEDMAELRDAVVLVHQRIC